MNLDIPEARILKQRHDEAPEVKFVDITPVEGGEEPEYKTLIELMQMEMPNEKKQFTCSGTITEIRTDIEWRYLSCPTCKCGFNAEGKCRQCNKTTDYPIQRYKIMMTLSDETATADLVLFNKEAEKVIGKPIEKLIDVYEKENGKEQVYEILQQCVGKKYIFRVKIGESKYSGERELKGQKTLPYQNQATMININAEDEQ
ncbi:hypothetical protein RND81_03G052700 [Saponaria officinalis]|uniref:Replication factor A C-terminal domain-containing protein n=1 Tax=Saponaria officinalis TaxID=3572 RepID=A0AAW1M3I5_SAPOF